MQYGGLFQTGNPDAGGWRFNYNDRPTSNAALQQANTIDPEFLKKVAGMKPEEKKGLLDAAMTAQPLQGLLDTGGAPGNDGRAGGDNGFLGGGGMQQGGSMTPGGNHAVNASPGGMSFGFDAAKGGLGLLSGGILGALGGVTAQRQAPVMDVALPGLNGFGFADTAYGTGANAMGAPNQAQAQALADALAAQLSQYEAGGGFGGSGGGYGGYGGDTSSGAGGMGFGGVY